MDEMDPAEAVRLLLAGVPEYRPMYEDEAPVATGDDGEPLLHVVFGNLGLFYEREVAGQRELQGRGSEGPSSSWRRRGAATSRTTRSPGLSLSTSASGTMRRSS
jgi:hypothetical protein